MFVNGKRIKAQEVKVLQSNDSVCFGCNAPTNELKYTFRLQKDNKAILERSPASFTMPPPSPHKGTVLSPTRQQPVSSPSRQQLVSSPTKQAVCSPTRQQPLLPQSNQQPVMSRTKQQQPVLPHAKRQDVVTPTKLGSVCSPTRQQPVLSYAKQQPVFTHTVQQSVVTPTKHQPGPALSTRKHSRSTGSESDTTPPLVKSVKVATQERPTVRKRLKLDKPEKRSRSSLTPTPPLPEEIASVTNSRFSATTPASAAGSNLAIVSASVELPRYGQTGVRINLSFSTDDMTNADDSFVDEILSRSDDTVLNETLCGDAKSTNANADDSFVDDLLSRSDNTVLNETLCGDNVSMEEMSPSLSSTHSPPFLTTNQQETDDQLFDEILSKSDSTLLDETVLNSQHSNSGAAPPSTPPVDSGDECDEFDTIISQSQDALLQEAGNAMHQSDCSVPTAVGNAVDQSDFSVPTGLSFTTLSQSPLRVSLTRKISSPQVVPLTRKISSPQVVPQTISSTPVTSPPTSVVPSSDILALSRGAESPLKVVSPPCAAPTLASPLKSRGLDVVVSPLKVVPATSAGSTSSVLASPVKSRGLDVVVTPLKVVPTACAVTSPHIKQTSGACNVMPSPAKHTRAVASPDVKALPKVSGSGSAKPSPALSVASTKSVEVDDLFDDFDPTSAERLVEEAIFSDGNVDVATPVSRGTMDGATIQVLAAQEKMEEEKHKLLSTIEALRSEVAAKNELITKHEQEEKNPGIMSSMKEEFTCVICQELFVRAHTLPCSHSFCEHCIEQWSKTNKKCPVCRKQFFSGLVHSLALDNAIENLEAQMSTEEREERKALKEERKALKEGWKGGSTGATSSSTTTTSSSASGAVPDVIVIGTPPTTSSQTSSSQLDSEDESSSEEESSDESDGGYYHGGYAGYGRCYNCGKYMCACSCI